MPVSQINVSGLENSGNTLIYSPSANTLVAYTSATERLRIDSTGKVGIGITSPTSNLHVIGANISAMANSVITSGTSVASTSGTSIDFTGIPSWVKRITVMLNGVSFATTAAIPMIQIGAGSVANSGYTAAAGDYVSIANFSSNTTGFNLAGAAGNIGHISNNIYGQVVLVNITGNVWCCASSLSAYGGTTSTATGSGTVTLGGAIDRVRLTSVAGTSTFDAGSINILYE